MMLSKTRADEATVGVLLALAPVGLAACGEEDDSASSDGQGTESCGVDLGSDITDASLPVVGSQSDHC